MYIKNFLNLPIQKSQSFEKRHNNNAYLVCTIYQIESRKEGRGRTGKTGSYQLPTPQKGSSNNGANRKKWVEVPAISSYIFIKITADQYRSVFAVNGVVAYVSHKGNALAIPEHEIIAMQRTIENKINFNVVAGDIKKGEEITVTSGPLCGIKGIVQTVQGTKKLYLNISNIGYTLVVDLQEASVEKQ